MPKSIIRVSFSKMIQFSGERSLCKSSLAAKSLAPVKKYIVTDTHHEHELFLRAIQLRKTMATSKLTFNICLK